MTGEDRSEVREMIVTVLNGFHKSNVERDKQTELREKLIYASLNNIDGRLDKLNGKVSEHEKTILENLPHSIAHCNQSDSIKELHDAMIITKGEKQGKASVSSHKQVSFNNLFTVLGFLAVIAGLIITTIIGRNDNKKIETRIDNFGTPVIINQRGEITRLPEGDSLKYYRDGEFKDSYKDSMK